jgi:hypothetical protein
MTQVGYTYYNDPPPGAGGLNNNEYCFAELGTATQGGAATGHGNLAAALGMSGELPMGTKLTASANGHSITIVKRDRGYGQGGNGQNSNPYYCIDFWDGESYGGKNPLKALGLGREGVVNVSKPGSGGILGAIENGIKQVPGAGPLIGGAVGDAVGGVTDVGSAISFIFSASGIDRILKVVGGGILLLIAADELIKSAGGSSPIPRVIPVE